MKRIIITVLLSLFIASPCLAQTYCYVQDGQIIEGPMKVPFSWHGVPGINKLSPERLKEWGLLPYIDTPPGYNSDTQYLTFVNTVNANDVTKTYTIHDYTGPEMVQRIADAKTAKVASLKALARQKALVQYSKWVKDRTTAIDALSTLEAIRDYELTSPDLDTISTNILAAIAASGIADMTFAQLDTWIDNNVIADPSVKMALKKIARPVLALLKLQMGNE